jgi:putative SbcD/Mre11-related phosphoesterase
MRVLTDWLLTPHRAAIHLGTGTAVIADVHLGYGQARCRRGDAIPSSELDVTIAALAPIVGRPEVHHLVIAGDLIEDAAGGELLSGLLAWLDSSGVELLGVIPGNHDRALQYTSCLPLQPEGVVLDGWRLVHGDRSLPREPSVCGHFHPCLRLRGRVAAPCYLVGKRRLVLPAFSVDAAGVNVLHDRRWRGYRCCVLNGSDVLDFGELGTLGKRISG